MTTKQSDADRDRVTDFVTENEGANVAIHRLDGEIATGHLTGKVTKAGVQFKDDEGKTRHVALPKIDTIEEVDEEGMSPKALAKEFNMAAKDLRVTLRSLFGRVGKGKRWSLTPDQVEKVRERFNKAEAK